jgi:hypothetical protein
MKRLMIDIEALSLRPEAAVLQIGYCLRDFAASPDWDEVGPTNIDLDVNAQIEAGRHVDFDTLKWWSTQDPAVVRSVIVQPTHRISAKEAFEHLAKVVTDRKVDEVWASPAMYDLPILTSLWGGRKPWVYNQERCMMTLYKALDPNGLRRPAPNGMAHNAAADAGWQMEYLVKLFRGV